MPKLCFAANKEYVNVDRLIELVIRVNIEHHHHRRDSEKTTGDEMSSASLNSTEVIIQDRR
jgi:hypothetical protein